MGYDPRAMKYSPVMDEKELAEVMRDAPTPPDPLSLRVESDFLKNRDKRLREVAEGFARCP